MMRAKRGYAVNGRFYTQNLTGVQRYASELLRELDTMVQKGELQVVVPSYCDAPSFSNIEVVKYGSLKGNVWEQVDFPRYLLKAKKSQVSLCNTVPLLSSGGIAAVHDISYKVNSHLFRGPRNTVGKYWRCLNYRKAIYGSDSLVTVSEFSKSEILRHYKVEESKITVIGNAWQHMSRVEADQGVFERLGIPATGFYFAMSSLASNKNIPWILDSARLTPNKMFVISGATAPSLDASALDCPKNVILAGYLSDGEAKALMASCEAFLFPTFYEGFGIPPLEAMACGAEVIVSDTPCMHEVYRDAATFIDPMQPLALDRLQRTGAENRESVLAMYSWEQGAERFQRIMEKYSL